MSHSVKIIGKIGDKNGDKLPGKNANPKPETIAECLARNIRNYRSEQGLTQGQLASAAQLSLVFLQNIESGRKWVGASTIDAIAEALQIPPCELFTAPENKKNPLRNVPKDILFHLETTCRHPKWRWENLRLIFEGFLARANRDSLPLKMQDH